MRDWHEMNARLDRTLHSGHKNRSLHVMEVAVEQFRKINKDKLSQVDQDYVCELSRKLTITPCAMMLAMVYLERLKVKNPEYMRQLSSSDLFLISTMMSSKYMHDEGIEDDVYNDDWADSVNMNIKDLNHLEMDFLQALDWALFVNAMDFQNALHAMEFEVAKRCAMIRGGWLTYTDLLVLTRQMDLASWLSENVMLIVSTGMVFYASLISLLTGYVASAMVTQSSSLIVSTPATNSDLLHQYLNPNLTPAEIDQTTQFQSGSVDLILSDEDSAEEDGNYKRELLGIREIVGHLPISMKENIAWKRSDIITQKIQNLAYGKRHSKFINEYLTVSSTEDQPPVNSVAENTDGTLLKHHGNELSELSAVSDDLDIGDDYKELNSLPAKSILMAVNELNNIKFLETFKEMIVANVTKVNRTGSYSHFSQSSLYKVFSCHWREYSQKPQKLCY